MVLPNPETLDSNDGSDTEKAQHVRDAREKLDLSRHKNDDLVAEGCSAEQNRDHATNATLPEENSREKTTDEGPSMLDSEDFQNEVEVSPSISSQQQQPRINETSKSDQQNDNAQEKESTDVIEGSMVSNIPDESMNNDVDTDTKNQTKANGDGTPDEETDASTEPSLEHRAKEAAKKVVDYSEYIQLVEMRLATLEAQMKAGDPQKKKIQDSPDNKRVPAIPELQRVNWAGFKNKIKDTKEVYAVEALVGDVKYYYQRNKQQKQDIRQITDTANEASRTPGQQSIRALKDSRDQASRIRINSKPVLMILEEILDLELDNTVHLYPFKILAQHNDAIRAELAALEAKWASAEDEMDSSKRKGSQPTTNGEESGPGLSPANQSQADVYAVISTTESPSKIEEEHEHKKLKEDSKQPAEPEDLTDSIEAMKDLRCLVRFMDEDLADFDRYRKPNPPRRVSFKDLWHLFKPGDEVFAPVQAVYGTDEGQRDPKKSPPRRLHHQRYQEAFRIISTWGGRSNLSSDSDETALIPKQKINPFTLYCYYLDFNGKRFIPTTHHFDISPYEGEKDITSLELYPFAYLEDANKKRTALKERGELFREFVTFKHRMYKGPTLVCSPCGCSLPRGYLPTYSEDIDSEVIVDFAEAIRDKSDWSPFVKGGNSTGTYFRETEDDLSVFIWKDESQLDLEEENEDLIFDDYVVDHAMTTNLETNDPLLRDDPDRAVTAGEALREQDLMLLPARVLAYVLRKQYFAALNIEHLQEVVKPYKQGWKDLQLPKGHKRMLRSLVKTHLSDKQLQAKKAREGHEYDIVKGKGQGLIVLLHGAPGVGKTSTAETVAESESKPLLSITCGDLGLTAESVERALDHKFHLASAWDCILLLDEADVFLAARTRADLQRNALVSVFLRVLEYYTGILFLTTNRVGAFDDAFKSRIHLPLYYPPLDLDQTKKIWEINFDRTIDRKEQVLKADKEEILSFAVSHFHDGRQKGTTWNGRQIRNAFQTATALAEFDAFERQQKDIKDKKKKPSAPVLAKLRPKHFEVVAQASFTFDDYLYSVHNESDLAERAKGAEERDDAFAAQEVTMRAANLGLRQADVNEPRHEVYDQSVYQQRGAVQSAFTTTDQRFLAQPGQMPILQPSTRTSPRQSQQQFFYQASPRDQNYIPTADNRGRFPRPVDQSQIYSQPQMPYLARQDVIPDDGRYPNLQTQRVPSPQRPIRPSMPTTTKSVTPAIPAQTYSDNEDDDEEARSEADEDHD